MELSYKATEDPQEHASAAVLAEIENQQEKAKELPMLRTFNDLSDYDTFKVSNLDMPMSAARVKDELGLIVDDYSGLLQVLIRAKFVQHYAWSVPTEEALKAITDFANGPIEEHMAGGGYWAFLLRDFYNAKITPYDRGPRKFHTPLTIWTDIYKHDSTDGPISQEATIMINWPPMSEAAAKLVTKMAVGQKLILIGERDGCTGSADLDNLLYTCFKYEGEFEIPQWPGMHDYIAFLTRTKEGE